MSFEPNNLVVQCPADSCPFGSGYSLGPSFVMALPQEGNSSDSTGSITLVCAFCEAKWKPVLFNLKTEEMKIMEDIANDHFRKRVLRADEFCDETGPCTVDMERYVQILNTVSLCETCVYHFCNSEAKILKDQLDYLVKMSGQKEFSDMLADPWLDLKRFAYFKLKHKQESIAEKLRLIENSKLTKPSAIMTSIPSSRATTPCKSPEIAMANSYSITSSQPQDFQIEQALSNNRKSPDTNYESAADENRDLTDEEPSAKRAKMNKSKPSFPTPKVTSSPVVYAKKSAPPSPASSKGKSCDKSTMQEEEGRKRKSGPKSKTKSAASKPKPESTTNEKPTSKYKGTSVGAGVAGTPPNRNQIQAGGKVFTEAEDSSTDDSDSD